MFADIVRTLCEHDLKPLEMKVKIYFQWAFVERFRTIILLTDVKKNI